MPLPFSFSAQRHTPEAELPTGQVGAFPVEKVMGNAPANISTEPLLGTPGNTFSPPPFEMAKAGFRLSPSHLPPAPSPNHRLSAVGSSGSEPEATLQLPFSAAQPTPHTAASQSQDWGTQIEQVRNDVFSIAMSVSALSDRLDRLEQRVPQNGPSMQESITALRSEIEAWLGSHLNLAVEHCMQRFLQNTNSNL